MNYVNHDKVEILKFIKFCTIFIKNNNMDISNIKISLNMENKGWLNIEKHIKKLGKALHFN